ncbi:ATP-binding protein [Massilia litorea]|uniref:histidine kinase n=1 Tax=Massilia litorea TaxID=2769491 RepID=A0A7L9U1B8_9BURK|nr:ATP-binding protein [Massilia litorea]QOL47866.1 HAMP domain-containing protein [Massilia litorea]
MKISIGLRLFLSVLLAILAVAASAVFLLRQNVLESFGDYAVQIELDRLEELSNDLARRYAQHGDWRFVPAGARRDWITRELARLQAEREARALPAAPAPAAPVRAVPAVPAVPSAPVAAVAAPAPPAPPAPPLPPLPPPPLHEASEPAEAASLQSRITLFDAAGRVLAGRPPGALPLARRPILVDGRTVGFLAVARTARPTDALAYAFLQQLGASLWPIAAAGVLLSALAATLLASHFRRPIGRLAQGARALADGRFDTRLKDDRSDELGELAGHFNVLAARLEGAESARRQWVADTSHELRTPLAVLRAQLEALQDGVRSADPGHVAAMLRQVLALSKLIDELYALARADVGALDCRREPLDLWGLACEEAQSFTDRFKAAGLTLETGNAPPQSEVLADADRMRQVLRNLFENSLRYTGTPGRVALSARVAEGRFELVIDDSTPGVPEAALAHLGERFYRVDASRSRAGGGAGLGLALCLRLVEAQGGELRFAHSPLGGLRATLSFRRVE